MYEKRKGEVSSLSPLMGKGMPAWWGRGQRNRWRKENHRKGRCRQSKCLYKRGGAVRSFLREIQRLLYTEERRERLSLLGLLKKG